MEIIFDGRHSEAEASETLASVLHLLKDRYHINQFREIHLSVTLVDSQGEDVELVDTQTNMPFRILEVYRSQEAFSVSKLIRSPSLKLVVDNTINKA